MGRPDRWGTVDGSNVSDEKMRHTPHQIAARKTQYQCTPPYPRSTPICQLVDSQQAVELKELFGVLQQYDLHRWWHGSESRGRGGTYV